MMSFTRAFSLAAYGGGMGKVGGDTPHPAKRPAAPWNPC